MNKIQKVSISLKYFFQFALVFIASTFVISWIAVAVNYTQMTNAPFHFFASLFKFTAYLSIIYLLIKLFDSYANGQIFTPINIRLIRNIGITLLLLQIGTPLIFHVHTWYMSGSVGNIELFPLSRIELTTLAALIIIHSWVMQEAYNLKQDQELTV